ncbi:MAG: cytochrome d ubiquinol oxidase subunit II, partial [Rhizobiales bacterium]|nr:cytochrome d ubiquinol oxidase subunit II [Hyphomicrobiales bacterium]
QVWLILGGGAIFAAWPAIYATSFSGFYIAMIAILLALILRPVGFKFRGKVANRTWRSVWDWGLFIGGAPPPPPPPPPLGNLLLGAPFSFDDTLRPVYSGNFFGLLTPFALLAGLVSLAMLVTQGAVIIAKRTTGAVAERARVIGRLSALATIVLFVLGGLAIASLVDGYRITSVVDPNGPSNPMGKSVAVEAGAWLANYAAHPVLWLVPALGILGSLLAFIGLSGRRGVLAILASSLAIVGIVATAGISMFPFLMPSSADPKASLPVWDASSSQLTLFIMLVATLFFMPIVLVYTAWVYRVMRGPVTVASLGRNPNAY